MNARRFALAAPAMTPAARTDFLPAAAHPTMAGSPTADSRNVNNSVSKLGGGMALFPIPAFPRRHYTRPTPMNTPRRSLPSDPLFTIERQIARRADELTRCHGIDPAQALAAWRQAEAEVWDTSRAIDSAGFVLTPVPCRRS